MRASVLWRLVKFASLAIFVSLVLYIGTIVGKTDRFSSHAVTPSRSLLSTNDTDADSICSSIHHYSEDQRCHIAETYCSPEGFFNYYKFYFCTCKGYPILSLPLLFCALILVFYLLGTAAEEYFCPTLAVISKKLHIAPDVAGVTLLALGNGAPDVFSTFAAVKSDAFPIALSELAGAGVFITTVIVGTVALVSDCVLKRVSFLRDVVFFLVVCLSILAIFNDGRVSLWESIGFLMFYFFYVGFTVFLHFYKKDNEENGDVSVNKLKPSAEQCVYKQPLTEQSPLLPHSSPFARLRQVYLAKIGIYFSGPATHPIHHVHPEKKTMEQEEQTIHESAKLIEGTTGADYWIQNLIYTFKTKNKWHKKNTYQRVLFITVLPFKIAFALTIPTVKDKHWNRYLATLYPLFSLNFVMLTNGGLAISFGSVPLYAIVEPVALLLSIIVWCTTSHSKPPKYKPIFLVAAFILSVVWIYLIANEIVSLLETLGSIFNISEAVLGIILAWGNSVSDFVADVVVARKGLPGMSVAACFAGPLFNLLVGLGVSLTAKCASSYPKPFEFELTLKHNITFAFLIISLVSSLIIVPLCHFRVKKGFGIYLLILNAMFSGVIIAVEISNFSYNVPPLRSIL